MTALTGRRGWIRVSQELPPLAAGLLKRLRRGSSSTPHFLENVRRIGPASKRALLVLSPAAWLRAEAEYPGIRQFNYVGMTWEIVDALHQRSYAVDVVDFRHEDFVPPVSYDVVIAHGAWCKPMLERLGNGSFVIHYASGAYWRAFNDMSAERYVEFCRRKGLPDGRRYVRSMAGLEKGEEYLARRADATFISGPRTLETWKGISKDLHLVYLGSYVEQDLLVERDFRTSPNDFLYVAGTGGNVQKGLDLLLEVFAENRECRLYIYCEVEEEVLDVYGRELRLPNIRYIYHLRYGPLRRRLREILGHVAFTISAPIDTGPGTAFVGSLGLGLIPAGYVDIDAMPDEGVVADTWSISALAGAVRSAANKSPEWLEAASRRTLDRYRRLHAPDGFRKNFGVFLDKVLPD